MIICSLTNTGNILWRKLGCSWLVRHFHPSSYFPERVQTWLPCEPKVHQATPVPTVKTDLLLALNNFSGYLEASGYDKAATLTFFTDILKISNRTLAFKIKEPDTSFKVPLVTKLHPALPNLAKMIDQFYPVIKNCPLSSTIFPRDSLLTAHRKLPTLSNILASNPFQVPRTPTSPKGFHQTPGCSCKLCKEATFGTFITPSNSQGRGFSIPAPINCLAANVIYSIACPCGRLYVGKTAEPKSRWSNHKSHIRNGHKTCNLAVHCLDHHTDTMVGAGKLFASPDVKNLLTITLLEAVGENATMESLEKCEEQWRNRLQSWSPNGLNIREDGPQSLRKKKVKFS